MFTPENLYFTIREYVGTDSILMKPKQNGDKRWADFVPFLCPDHDRDYYHQNLCNQAEKTQIWLHDQEPLSESITQDVRTRLQYFCDPDIHSLIASTEFAPLLQTQNPTSKFSIWCTSEQSGYEIRAMEQINYIICNYWFHAFVARDWFRHWERSPSIINRPVENHQTRFLLYARAFSGTRSYRQELIDGLRSMQSAVLYDWDNKKSISSDHSAMIDIEHGSVNRVHLVAETLYDTDKIYLTEKIFKPIVMNQPFLLWGPPGSLQYLRRYGFRTFDTCWSEAYDKELDADKRMKLLLDLVNKIAQMDDDQFDALLLKCEPIVKHNRERFFSKDFMDYCWNELMTSFRYAFDQQKLLLQEFPWGQTCEIIGKHPDLLRIPSRKAILKQLLLTMDGNTKNQLFRRYAFFNEL